MREYKLPWLAILFNLDASLFSEIETISIPTSTNLSFVDVDAQHENSLHENTLPA